MGRSLLALALALALAWSAVANIQINNKPVCNSPAPSWAGAYRTKTSIDGQSFDGLIELRKAGEHVYYYDGHSKGEHVKGVANATGDTLTIAWTCGKMIGLSEWAKSGKGYWVSRVGDGTRRTEEFALLKEAK